MFELPALTRRAQKRLMRSVLIPAAVGLLAVPATATAAPSAMPGMTFYVDGASVNGTCSDSYTSTQATNPSTPWCTITKAVTTVGPSATVDVVPATYHESVVLSAQDDGVTLQGDGGQPVIDGDMTRSTGISLTNGVYDVTINGFEIENVTAGATGDAAGIYGTDTYGDVIENNVIHDIHAAGKYSYGIMLGNNSDPGMVNGITVDDNRIYNIGPGGESMGIWLLMTTQMTIENNEIYLVRKEGIRDWGGYDNSIISNRTYLNWVGIALEASVGDYVANNLSYNNVYGFNPKHVSDAATLALWNLTSVPYTRIWHNTAYGNTYASIALGMNAPDEDYMDIEDNLFADAGAVEVQDFPTLRGSHVLLNGDVYRGSAPLYDTTFNNPSPLVYTTLGQLQSQLGWEANGQVDSGSLQNAAAGGAAVAPSGVSAGVALPDSYGSQIGAVGVAPATMSWARYPTTVVQSSPEPSYMNPQAAGDGSDYTYWWNGSGTTGTVTFDLGAPESINTFVLDVYSQFDLNNPQGYAISVSNDDVNWTQVASGNNPDTEGSSYKYELSSPVTARYVRLQILSNFGGSSVIFSDFEIGLLSPTGSPQSAAALQAASVSQAYAAPTGGAKTKSQPVAAKPAKPTAVASGSSGTPSTATKSAAAANPGRTTQRRTSATKPAAADRHKHRHKRSPHSARERSHARRARHPRRHRRRA